MNLSPAMLRSDSEELPQLSYKYRNQAKPVGSAMPGHYRCILKKAKTSKE